MKEVRNTIIGLVLFGVWIWVVGDACSGTNVWYVFFAFLLLWPIKEILMWLGDGTERPSKHQEPRGGPWDGDGG